MHPDVSVLIRLRDRRLSETEEEAVRAHLETCEECADTRRRIERFMADLDESWTRRRLAEAAARTHWPTREDLVDYYLDDLPSVESRQAIELHVRDCATCREILADLERGAAELQRDDPLREPVVGSRGEPGWLDSLRALLRPGAWPAWSLAAAAAAVVFVMGFVLRPIVWPMREAGRTGQVAGVPKPPLARQPDGSFALGIGPSVRPEARALLLKALESYDTADFADRALPTLEQAVQADPTLEQARFWLGVCYLLKGNAGAAIPHLEEASRLAPGNVTYQHYLVWGYLRAGQYRKALDAQTRLLGGVKQ